MLVWLGFAFAASAACSVEEPDYSFDDTGEVAGAGGAGGAGDSAEAGESGQAGSASAPRAGAGGEAGAPSAAGTAGAAGTADAAGAAGQVGTGGTTAGAGGQDGQGGQGGEAGPVTSACEPGDVGCQGLTPLSCQDGELLPSGSDCEFACQSGVCGGDCSPDDRRCVDGVHQDCGEDFSWSVVMTCEFVCDAELGCVGACVDGRRQCNGDRDLEVCTDGVFEPEQICPYVCRADECTGECSPGDSDCQNLTARTCDNDGQWQTQLCANACLGGQCVPCDPGSEQCVGAVPNVCDDQGQWQAQPACAGDTPRCLETGSSAICACEEDALDCLTGTTPEQCDASGNWVALASCVGDTPLCSGGACLCTPNGPMDCPSPTQARSCVGGTLLTVACSGDTPVCDDGECASCVSGDKECLYGDLRTCIEGNWSGTPCDVGCVNEECLDDTIGVAGVVTCDVTTGLTCAGSPTCCYDSSTATGSCNASCPQGGPLNNIKCDGPNDCPGQICCLTNSTSGPWTQCYAACPANTTQSTTWRVCNPDAVTCPVSQPACTATSIQETPIYRCQ